MNYITTTDLRTKSSQLVLALKNGFSVSLVHRSTIIGEIRPKEKQSAKIFTKESAEKLKRLAHELLVPKLSDKEIERRYRKHLMEKYGKYLS